MLEYGIIDENTYNADEKGFAIGVTNCSKRVFTKAVWASKECTAAIQDGNREWITLLACVCASGEALPPALIYEGKAGLQSSWVDAVETYKHQLFFANSASGWTNNELGLAWLEQVFQRFTKEKARRQWRLLILDGHGSHVTTEFIDFCDANKILLAVFPPHATHTLQPLDVGLFSPLSSNYSRELDRHLGRSQGLIGVNKGDFFSIFWEAWSSTMTVDSIKKSFQATGVWPMDAEVILKRFNNTTTRQDTASRIRENGDRDSWSQLRKVFDAAVADKAKDEAKQLAVALHSLQAQNELLHHENNGLRAAISTKKRHQKKSKTLDLQHGEEYHGGATFWSPRKIQEAREREATKQQEAEQLQLQKSEMKELKAASIIYKKKLAEEAKAERKRAKQARDAAKKAKAEELAAARALKQQQRNAATSQKSRDTHKTGKRAASRTPISKNLKRRRGVDAESGAAPAPPPPQQPPKTSSRGRPIRMPQKFK